MNVFSVQSLKNSTSVFFFLAFFASAGWTGAEETLFTSSTFLTSGKFISSIEGPACDIEGNLYAVSYGKAGSIGTVTPDGTSSLFVTLPTGSTGNGIRFDSHDRMLVADYTGHNILAVDMKTREISVYAHESSMNQPNDIAIGSNDILYASDPDWNNSTGNVWRITTDGTVTLLSAGMSTTNGIEVAPGDSILYVNESTKYNIWAYSLSPSGAISNRRLLIKLPDTTLDGMRCDTAGNLYVTRMGVGRIAIVSPEGQLLREVKLLQKNPSNIEFGGPDGRTCYVTMADDGSIETFRTDTPGRSWQMYQDRTNTRVAERTVSPRTFTLDGNYPNPFNPSTTIKYTLQSNTTMELAVYNAIGQLVTVLKQGMESAGEHTITWNARNMPSGVYVMRMKAGGTSETRKMLLMK